MIQLRTLSGSEFFVQCITWLKWSLLNCTVSVHCRLKEIPSNAQDVLFPSFHSGVEHRSPTDLYNKSLTSQVLIVCSVKHSAFWLTHRAASQHPHLVPEMLF